ncbi:MAG: NAD-dependent DNA ligase LigA [Saprospirales bacterium]|nr:MAG: NAD-dependent DNA ligase LigA [Saprospirales bacterium]
MYSKQEEMEILNSTENLLKIAEDSGRNFTREELSDLVEVLRYHEWKYYVKNDPAITDREYDILYKMLERWETEKPGWQLEDSPTKRVGSDLSSNFSTVKHLVPMLSLGNSYNLEDLQNFSDQIGRILKNEEKQDIAFASEPKYDGSSISLLYVEDRLVRAATRGNGAEGEEITSNVRTLKTVPLRVSFSKYGIHTAELRGEAMIRLDVFEKLNKEREQKGMSLFANPRNAAAGGLRMKDPSEAASRGLEMIVYQIGYVADVEGNNLMENFGTHSETLELLDKLGFKSSYPDHKIHSDLEEMIAHFTKWEAKRSDYPFELDGMVVKVNDLSLQQKIGSTSHHPRWAIAYKFKARQATSRLLRVDYQVGKVGTITPVAKIQPVPLAGVTISSVSLHNEEFINSKDIRIGDRVLVERAGDVIPYIVKSLPEFRTGEEVPMRFPKYCPVNDTDTEVPLIKMEEEAAWRCSKCVCGAQELQKMIFFVSKDAMDIAGLGKSLVERFFKNGMVRSIPDLYRLDYHAISKMEGFGQRSAQNLKKAIEDSKNRPLKRLLYALGIHHLGKRASSIIASEIEHIIDLKDWEEDKYLELRDIGPVVAKNIRSWFQIEDNLQMLIELEQLGLNMNSTADDKPTAKKEGPLSGKTILFTGSLEKMSRKEAQTLAENAGAKNLSAVSSNLNILVAGAKAGSKLKKAQNIGTVQILSEEEFYSLIEG